MDSITIRLQWLVFVDTLLVELFISFWASTLILTVFIYFISILVIILIYKCAFCWASWFYLDLRYFSCLIKVVGFSVFEKAFLLDSEKCMTGNVLYNDNTLVKKFSNLLFLQLKYYWLLNTKYLLCFLTPTEIKNHNNRSILSTKGRDDR